MCCDVHIAYSLRVFRSEVGEVGSGRHCYQFGVVEPTAATVASSAAGLRAAMAAQHVWTCVDVKIIKNDGAREFHWGFGILILTYAPSYAVWWWVSYSVVHRMDWAWVVPGEESGDLVGNNNVGVV
ncbi:hypothetical protein ACSQ67_023830 [Phaseolus vulgaris]